MDDRNHILCVILQAGNRLCALPVVHVVETLRPLSVDSIPGAAPFVLGVAVIRGLPLPVVDLQHLLTGVAAAPGTLARFVTVRSGTREVVLAVHAVPGVWSCPAGSQHALPPLLREAQPDLIEALGVLDAGLALLLDTARLLPAGALPPTWPAPQKQPAQATV